MTKFINKPLTISQYIIEKLVEHNCKHVIGIPATNCAAFFDAMDTNKEKIKYIIPTSELEAGYIADGYARNGELSALCVAYGVGTLSLANPIAGAFAEKLPIIIINGGPTSEEIAIESKLNSIFLHSTGRESNDYNVFKNITAFATIIKHPTEAKEKIDEAFKIAKEKSQPVYLEVPSDYWHLPVDAEETYGDELYFISELKKVLGEKILEKIVLQSDFSLNMEFNDVLVVVGSEVTRNELSKDMLNFITKYKLNFVTTPLSKTFEGVLSVDDVNLVDYNNNKESEDGKANYWGCLDNITFISEAKKHLIESTKYFLCIGNVWGVDSKKFVVDNYSKMIEIGYGEARIGYKVFKDIRSLSNIVKDLPEIFKLSEINLKMKFDQFKVQMKLNQDSDDLITQDKLHEEVKNFIQCTERSPNLLFNVDACLAMFWGSEIKLKQNDQYISNPAWLSIGHSAPSSVGHYLKNGLPPLIITGDGGFQMVSQTYSTMLKYNIPALIIVVNNSILGIEEFLLDPKSERHEPFKYTEVRPWNYHKFPEVYNDSKNQGKGHLVTNVSELKKALDCWAKEINSKKKSVKYPTIINCVVDRDSIPTRITPKNIKISNSLLDTFKLR